MDNSESSRKGKGKDEEKEEMDDGQWMGMSNNSLRPPPSSCRTVQKCAHIKIN
jgi:hypothetical protein